MMFAFFVVSHFVLKLPRLKTIGAVNTFLTASTMLTWVNFGCSYFMFTFRFLGAVCRWIAFWQCRCPFPGTFSWWRNVANGEPGTWNGSCGSTILWLYPSYRVTGWSSKSARWGFYNRNLGQFPSFVFYLSSPSWEERLWGEAKDT